MRRTKPYLIYQKTKNLRAIQLLLSHKKPESTVRYMREVKLKPLWYTENHQQLASVNTG